MLTTGFSVKGTSLKLLRAGERGVITRLKPLPVDTTQRLKNLGLVPGQTIRLEQRFPRFIVWVGNHRVALNETMMNAVYIRLIES